MVNGLCILTATDVDDAITARVDKIKESYLMGYYNTDHAKHTALGMLQILQDLELIDDLWDYRDDIFKEIEGL